MSLLLLLLGCSAELERLPVTLHAEQVTEGYILGALLGEGSSLFIADRDGYILWRHDGTPGILTPVVAPARDGEHLLYNEFAEDRTVDIGAVNRLGIDGGLTESIRTESAHHTFTELPDGTVAYLAVDVRETEEYGGVVGDRLLEVHPDGTVTQVFSVWEHFEIVEHLNWNSNHYPQGHDWTHGNALYYNHEAQTYLISFRNISAVIEVDRATGKVVRQFGGEDRRYTVGGDGFLYQHGVHWTEDGTLLMTTSGAGGDADGLETWAVEYAVDSERRQLTEVWSYGRGEGLHARALGEAHRLPGGNTLVNWGTEGLLREIAPNGDVLWEMEGSTDEEFFGRTWFLKDISAFLD